MNIMVKELTNRDYIDHLYAKEVDGYIQVMQLSDNKVVNIKNYKGLSIEEAVGEYRGHLDTFITPNTTYNGKRGSNNIRHLRSLFIDLDHKEYSFNDLVYYTWELVLDGKIPKPSMVVASGRGAHLYWRIEHAPFQALATWQELEDYLCYQLKEVGADKKATDAARVLRLPDTLNSRNNVECKVMIINDEITYSMYDLREKYLKWKPKVFKEEVIEKTINNKVKKYKVLYFFTSYTLHIARADDILTICKLRKYNLTGYRNMILHCYAYWLGVTSRDEKQRELLVTELNNKFTEPLGDSALRAIFRCVPKAIEKFIAYEQGIRSGEVKRVSKGMRDKGGYWYKNNTLIERLDITREEQKTLKTIIDSKEKYRRNAETINKKNKDRQRANRRDIKGLTTREKNKRKLTKQIKNLKNKGLNNIEIAKNLDITRVYVSRILNSKV